MSAFLAGLEEGFLSLQYCQACRNWQTPDRLACRQCGASHIDRREPCGRGAVYARTDIHRAPDPAFEAILPYVLVLVALEEGPLLMGHGPPSLVIGKPVKAVVSKIAGRALVWFEPLHDNDDG